MRNQQQNHLGLVDVSLCSDKCVLQSLVKGCLITALGIKMEAFVYLIKVLLL